MDQYILFHENNTEETQIKHASILSHLDRRTLQCVTSIYKPTFLKKTMCSEFQIGIVASPIHFLLQTLEISPGSPREMILGAQNLDARTVCGY